VIVEAGNLKRDAKIRQLFEREKNAAAIACYGADERGLQQLIRDDVKAAGLTITAEAAARLAGLLGGDWAVSRSEIAKLTLYAADADGGEITLEHVDAIVGDSSTHAFEAAIAATLIGNATGALTQIDGLAAAGTPASVILNVLLRHLQNLHTVAAAIQRGEAFETAVGHLRPPPHFKAKDVLRAQVARWRAGAVAAAVGETHEAVRQTRLKPALEREITSELVIRLAREGQEGQKIKAGTARFQR
jgi:DNA polymerase-3 subunit delta